MPDLGERVIVLEQVAANMAKIVEDHEKRIRKTERILMYGMGVIGTMGFFLHALERIFKW